MLDSGRPGTGKESELVMTHFWISEEGALMIFAGQIDSIESAGGEISFYETEDEITGKTVEGWIVESIVTPDGNEELDEFVRNTVLEGVEYEEIEDEDEDALTQLSIAKVMDKVK